MHGKTSNIYHNAQGLFADIPSPFKAARYHSLEVSPDKQSLKNELNITASTDDGAIMALEHKQFPLYGVQFHPESFLTEHGFTLIHNFLQSGPLSESQ